MRRRIFGRGQLGLTLVETTVAATIGATALGIGATLTGSALRDSNSLYVRSALHIKAQDTTDAIVREIQTGTLLGEDANGNHVLDVGEDANRNARLEADWSLTDGGSAATITFNKLQDGWLWSDPITYSVVSGALVRTQNGTQRVLCTGVTNVEFLRSGSIVDVSMTLTAKDRRGVLWTENAKRRANVRN